jgi:O-antigen/teichoic acid export membrane protein
MLAVLEGSGQLTTSRLITGTQQFISVAGLATISTSTKSLIALAIWQLLVAIATRLLLTCFLRAIASAPANRLTSQQAELLWKSSWPFGILFCGTFLYGNTQVPMLGAVVDPESIASFYVVQRILYFTSLGAHQVVMAAVPRFTYLLGGGKHVEARLLLKRGLFVGIVLQTTGAICAMMGLRLFGYDIFNIAPMSSAFEILYVVDIICMGVTNMFAIFVIASGRNPVWGLTLIGGVTNLVFGMFAASHWGVESLPIVSLLVGGATFYGANSIYFFRLIKSLSKREGIV